MTLLEAAKSVTVLRGKRQQTKNRSIVRERAEMALAYLKGEISGSQVVAVTGCNKNAVSSTLAFYIYSALRTGILVGSFVDEAEATK